jgi:hypothetical protein
MGAKPARDDLLGSAPSLLLLSGTSPGVGHVGEILLGDLVRAYPAGLITAMAFKAPVMHEDALLKRCPLEVMASPYDRRYRRRPGLLGAARAVTRALISLDSFARRAARRAQALARESGSQKAWVVLDTPTSIATAFHLRGTLPLLVQVWDPPEAVLRGAAYDQVSRRWLKRRFEDVLRSAERVAVISENMAEDYSPLCTTRPIVLRHGVVTSGNFAETRVRPGPPTQFRVGLAGTLYAASAWNALLAALTAARWQVGGVPVQLRVLSSSLQAHCQGPAHIEYLGWRTPEEVQTLLGECDVGYLPHPFEAALRPLARYSFPTKFSAYVAARLPVFAHAPSYSSIATFLARHEIGASCTSLETEAVRDALHQLLTDADALMRIRQAQERVYESHFSPQQFRQRFAEFVGASGADWA